MYAELHALSNFSFLRGASQPEELIDQAKRWAIGRSRSPMNARSRAWCARTSPPSSTGCRCIIGTELNCADELKLVALATDRASYGALCRLISRARRASAKGSYALARADLAEHSTAA